MKTKLIWLGAFLAPIAAFAVDPEAQTVLEEAAGAAVTSGVKVASAAMAIFAALVIYRVVKRAFNAGK